MGTYYYLLLTILNSSKIEKKTIKIVTLLAIDYISVIVPII